MHIQIHNQIYKHTAKLIMILSISFLAQVIAFASHAHAAPPALSSSHTDDTQIALGKNNIKKMGGCFLVDYNYLETKSLKNGYVRDERLYEVNTNKSVKEWIYVDELSPKRLFVQHVLFATQGADGAVNEDSLLKHTGEDWEFDAPHLYEFVSPQHWNVRRLNDMQKKWTRKITNLDSCLGLRRQLCADSWA
jgi:hypothetical protein